MGLTPFRHTFTAANGRSRRLPPRDGPPQNTSTMAFNLPFCGQIVLTTYGFPDTLSSLIFCLPFPWILASFPTSFFNLGVHMALQGWVLIEEQLNCLDMLCIYYPTVNLVMFALGLDLWGNECQMKMYLDSFASLLTLSGRSVVMTC